MLTRFFRNVARKVNFSQLHARSLLVAKCKLPKTANPVDQYLRAAVGSVFLTAAGMCLGGRQFVSCNPEHPSAREPWEDEWQLWREEILSSGTHVLHRRADIARTSEVGQPTNLSWHLIHGSLWGRGRIESMEIFRPAGAITEADSLALIHLGDQISGHKQFIHGGFTSAILDHLFGTGLPPK
eukprot:SAG31_NODE_2637_length_5336_cov_2.105977_6_plen_183_part_00